ncbi:response regulator [Paenibacillus gorillae]|uniref:response regulator n=2 Tax=Bacillota TaxID=1239 RepID=UPI0005A8C0A5|nr:response regulator [Paenibacillus gorillae]
MLKLLIVDDEQIEREGLMAIIKDGFPDVIFEQARNGKAAVELVSHFQPDLILMDIKMPIMNGLEAVECIVGDYPDMRFIMVTAYDTFDYARKAIKLGVKDYLLKPSKISEIRDTVGRVLKQIEEEREERQTQHQVKRTLDRIMPLVEADVVTQLLFDHVHEVHLDEMIHLLGGSDTKEAFVLLVQAGAGAATEQLYAGVKLRLRQMGKGWAGAMNGRYLPIVVFMESQKSFRAQAASIVHELLALPQLSGTSDCIIGVGNARQSLDDIRYSYHEALLAAAAGRQCQLQQGKAFARHRFYADKAAETEREGVEYAGKGMEKQLMEFVRLGQWTAAEAVIYPLADRYEASGMDVHQAEQRMLETLWIVFRGLLELGVETELPYYGFQIHRYSELRTETKCLLLRMCKDAEEQLNRDQPDAIAEVKQYIIANSHLDISLETIAKQAGLSPFYMSKMFKEQVGIGYIDFLTDCRVERAKALMGDADRSLKEIAYEVGYHDPNYFSKVFKKICGASPTDYRKVLLGK